MRTYVFEHMDTKARVVIQATDAYEAWSKLRESHNHKAFLRVGGPDD